MTHTYTREERAKIEQLFANAHAVINESGHLDQEEVFEKGLTADDLTILDAPVYVDGRFHTRIELCQGSDLEWYVISDCESPSWIEDVEAWLLMQNHKERVSKALESILDEPFYLQTVFARNQGEPRWEIVDKIRYVYTTDEKWVEEKDLTDAMTKVIFSEPLVTFPACKSWTLHRGSNGKHYIFDDSGDLISNDPVPFLLIWERSKERIEEALEYVLGRAVEIERTFTGDWSKDKPAWKIVE